MRYIRNNNGGYARHYEIEPEISRLNSKYSESRLNTKRNNPIFNYNPQLKNVDPLPLFLAAMIYSRTRRKIF